ncbi:MAG: type IV pilus modification protein PilV [Gammaproteobacteria bacterium]|nr:type IV pilus modification protein PilV [Gammaproteobacteria bacterium]
MCGNTLQQRRQRGFTMIEVMVAVLVLSIGLLGIASLLSVTKRSEHQAWQRSLALSLADGMVERIRVNPGSAAAYHTGIGTNALGGGTIVTLPTDCSAQSCSTAQMAAWDLWEWERRLDGAAIRDAGVNSVGGLIEPHGCIVFESAGGSMPNTGKLRVIVSWRGLTDTSDAVAVSGQICGPGAAGTLASRRQVVVNTYVIDEGDLP